MGQVQRWSFVTDANGDGGFTVYDIWSIILWIFYLPGDYVIFFVLNHEPGLARFLEWSQASYGGSASAVISACVWVFVILNVWVFAMDPTLLVQILLCVAIAAAGLYLAGLIATWLL